MVVVLLFVIAAVIAVLDGGYALTNTTYTRRAYPLAIAFIAAGLAAWKGGL